jgi:uncharacterized protein YkwD
MILRLAFSFVVLAGCGNSSTTSVVVQCDPPCRAGYVCVTGSCVESPCNPPCEAGTVCNPDTLDCDPAGDADADADGDADTDSDADTDTDTEGECPGLPVWTPEDAAREQQMLELVNAMRASGTCFGADFPIAAPLVMNDALRCASRELAKHIGDTCDAGACEWSHCAGVAGEGFCQRFVKYGYGDNAGWAGNYMGSDAPQDSLDAWTDSPDGSDTDSLPDGCEVPMSVDYVDFGVGSWDGFFWAVGYAAPGGQACRDLADTAGDGFDADCDGVDG